MSKEFRPWKIDEAQLLPASVHDYYENHDQLRQHLTDFVAAYNFARRLKTKGLTPYEFICKAWAAQPERFKLDPLQQMPGLNI